MILKLNVTPGRQLCASSVGMSPEKPLAPTPLNFIDNVIIGSRWTTKKRRSNPPKTVFTGCNRNSAFNYKSEKDILVDRVKRMKSIGQQRRKVADEFDFVILIGYTATWQRNHICHLSK